MPTESCSSFFSFCSAQAAHWFDWTKFWPECARVLRKGGSAAFWVRFLPFLPYLHAHRTNNYPHRSTLNSVSRATPPSLLSSLRMRRAQRILLPPLVHTGNSLAGP